MPDENQPPSTESHPTPVLSAGARRAGRCLRRRSSASPAAAWRRAGIPDDWCPVLERNPEAMNPDPLPGYVWLDATPRRLHVWAEHLEFRDEPRERPVTKAGRMFRLADGRPGRHLLPEEVIARRACCLGSDESEGYASMGQINCPVCGSASSGGHSIGDSTVFICPKCGGYRLAGTAIALLENGTLQKPDPGWFRALVQRKRGDSMDYPVISAGDLGG